MRILLAVLLCFVAFASYGQALWRNFFTTNQAPIVEVVAGSNATVQATTPNVFTRRFTVNGMPSGGGTVYGSNVVGAVNESVHATNADASITATFVLTSPLTNNVYGSNVIGSVSEATHATNADNATTATTATTATFVSTAILTNQTYASNVVSGGQIVVGGVETNQVDTGFIQLTGDKRKTTLNGSVLTNITGANVVGAVAQATHATNADLASFVSGTLTNNISGKAAFADDVSTNKLPQSAITNQTPRVIGITIDGGGIAISTGFKGVVEVPYACTIVGATMMADQYGGCGINVYRTNGFVPIASSWTTTAQKISGAATPVITQTNWSRDTTLTGWTTALVANDFIGFNVESNASITKVTLQLKLQP